MRLLFVIYDNDSFISWFPQGIGYIAAVCRLKGHEVQIYNQDVYHYPDEHLTELLDKSDYDVVGIGACGGYYQYRKVLQLCRAVRKSKREHVLILGGHLPSPEPEYFLRKAGADYVVIGEGEDTIVELLNQLESNANNPTASGIAYIRDQKLMMNPARKLIENIDSIPFPAWDLFPMEHYALLRFPNIKNNERSFPVLSGRGCTFTCNFCYRMDKGFRPRSIESIIEEISILKKNYHISYIGFSDELLMSSIERTINICESFIRSKINIRWDCNGRLNYAKPEVLKLMKDAGCVFINYGIESMDDATLRVMKKGLTEKMITKGIEETLAAGISPGLNIIFGNIGETRAALMKGVDFLLKYDDHSQLRTIRPVTPYPGSPLYYYAIEKGLLKDVEDFYERKHINSDLLTVNFTDLSDDEYYKCLLEANKRLLDNYIDHYKERYDSILDSLYIKKDASFRGFRQT